MSPPEPRQGAAGDASTPASPADPATPTNLATETSDNGITVSLIMRELARAPAVELGRVASQLSHTSLGRYRIVRKLGAGGMGEVYEAEDEALGRRVALKVLSPDLRLDAAGRQRILGEARAAAVLVHPHIAVIHDVGEVDDVAYLVMEMVDGVSVRTQIAQGPLPASTVLKLALQLADALAHIHERGIVHRDLKPENLMICRSGALKLLDFGLAIPAESQGYRSAAGTRGYMAPEQELGEPVDSRADIFAFGVTLVEMLTGRRFDPSQTRRSASGLEAALMAIAARCMRTSREERCADGRALREALGACAEAAASKRRRRLMLGLGLAAGAVLAIAVAIGLKLPRAQAPSGRPALAEERVTALASELYINAAALSPDGTRLAYATSRGLYLRNLEQTERKTTTQVPLQASLSIVHLSWLSSTALLVTSSANESAPVWRVELSGEMRPLPHDVRPLAAVASPDGTRVAFIEKQGLSWAALDKSEVHRLVSVGEGSGIGAAAWSPDSSELAYTRAWAEAEGFQAAIEIMPVPASSSGATRVVTDVRLLGDTGLMGLAWTRDGRLLYTLGAQTGAELWSLVPGAAQTPMLLYAWPDSMPHMLSVAAGGAVGFIKLENQLDVFISALDAPAGTPPQRLTLSDRNEVAWSWAASGDGVLYMTDRDSNLDVYRLARPGEQGQSPEFAEAVSEQPVLTGPESELAPILVDEQTLLYWRADAQVTGGTVPAALIRQDLATGKVQILMESVLGAADLAEPPLAFRHLDLRCPRRMNECVLVQVIEQRLVFERLDIRTGNRTPFLQVDAGGPIPRLSYDLSADGSSLALPQGLGTVRARLADGREASFAEAGSAVRIIDLQALQSRDIAVEGGCFVQWVAFGGRGDELITSGVCSEAGKPFRLSAHDAGGRERIIHESSVGWIGRPLTAPDGGRVVFSALQIDNDVWLLK